MHACTNKSLREWAIQLEKCITCPRCKYKLSTHKAQSETAIDKLESIGVCNHCLEQLQIEFEQCQHVFQNLCVSKYQKEKKSSKILSHFSRSFFTKKDERCVGLSRTFSETHMDKMNRLDYIQTHFKPELLIEKTSGTGPDIIKPPSEDRTRNVKFMTDSKISNTERSSMLDLDQSLINSMRTLDTKDFEIINKQWENLRLKKGNELLAPQYFDKLKLIHDYMDKKKMVSDDVRNDLNFDETISMDPYKFDLQLKLRSTSGTDIRRKTTASKKYELGGLLKTSVQPRKTSDDFNYLFLKKASPRQITPKFLKSSLELIKETKEMLNKIAAEKKEREKSRKQQIEEGKTIKTAKLIDRSEDQYKFFFSQNKVNIITEDRTIDSEDYIKLHTPKTQTSQKPNRDGDQTKKLNDNQTAHDYETNQSFQERDTKLQEKVKVSSKQEKKIKKNDKGGIAQEHEKVLPKYTKSNGIDVKVSKNIQKKGEKVRPAVKEKTYGTVDENEIVKKVNDEKKGKYAKENKNILERDDRLDFKIGKSVQKKDEKEKGIKGKEKTSMSVNENENIKKIMDVKAKEKLEDSTKNKHKDTKLKKESISEEDIEKPKKKTQTTTKDIPKTNDQAVDKLKPKKTAEQTVTKDIKVEKIKMKKSSSDDLILKLVKLKRSQPKPTCLSDINISPKEIITHQSHTNIRSPECAMCIDSELELDVENLNYMKSRNENDILDMVVGQQIIKAKHSLLNREAKEKSYPILYKSFFNEDLQFSTHDEELGDNLNKNRQKAPFSAAKQVTDQEIPKGIIKYTLSDRSFIDKGWTMLPTEKVVRKMNIYRMRPAHPEFDWFEHNKKKKEMYYDTGERLAEFDDNGRGRWFYRNGRLALDYYDADEINTQQRIVVYSNGEPDERGRSRPLAILATFDYLGNGVVFDHAGKIRLKYNQTEGVVLDRNIGPVSHWKWHTLNDPPVLQQVMIDTQLSHKDPDIMKLGGPETNKPKVDEEMLAIEFENFIKEKSKKLTQKFKPFQIKMKALKINEHFSLKVLDQATVYLIYRDGTTNLKLNIGMILNHQEIVDTDSAEVGDVANSLERFPARTDSLAGLQKSVEYAQRVERARMERDRRLRPPEPSASSDRITAATSKPLRPRLYTIPSSSAIPRSASRCRYTSSCNVYYDTRLI